MRIGPHKHDCEGCGKDVECCGDLQQLDDHANRFACVEYDRYTTYRCPSCEERHNQDTYDRQQEAPAWRGGEYQAYIAERVRPR